VEAQRFVSLIDGDYNVHMMLDGLPNLNGLRETQHSKRGFPVGFYREVGNGKRAHFLNNHLSMAILYNKGTEFEGIRVVGFKIQPFSVKHDFTTDSLGNKKSDFCKNTTNLDFSKVTELQQIDSKTGEIAFTYDVIWVQSDIKWSHRWDIYLTADPDREIHYFSIVNSLMITLFLTGVVAMIMLRALNKDIRMYNEAQSIEEAQEESGWKLVHGDVFRCPSIFPDLLAALVGTGVQLFIMTLTTISFAFMGFLSPANRGGMLTTVLVLFVLSGSAAGYWSARIYKFFGKKEWKKNILLTAILFPGIVFSIFWMLDISMWIEGSSTAVPFGTFVGLLLMWLGVSAPLVLLGSYWGFKAPAISLPVRINQIARHIPEQSFYASTIFSAILGGVLPFGAVCIELFFIMSALWLHQIYYVFGFLSVVFLILVVTCAEIAIVMCYFQLCGEDYRWWWRSFIGPGTSSLYLFAYSIWYYISKLELERGLTSFIYFGYMLLISIAFAILTGTVGFLSCFWFTRRIYAAIKVD